MADRYGQNQPDPNDQKWYAKYSKSKNKKYYCNDHIPTQDTDYTSQFDVPANYLAISESTEILLFGQTKSLIKQKNDTKILDTSMFRKIFSQISNTQNLKKEDRQIANALISTCDLAALHITSDPQNQLIPKFSDQSLDEARIRNIQNAVGAVVQNGDMHQIVTPEAPPRAIVQARTPDMSPERGLKRPRQHSPPPVARRSSRGRDVRSPNRRTISRRTISRSTSRRRSNSRRSISSRRSKSRSPPRRRSSRGRDRSHESPPRRSSRGRDESDSRDRGGRSSRGRDVGERGGRSSRGRDQGDTGFQGRSSRGRDVERGGFRGGRSSRGRDTGDRGGFRGGRMSQGRDFGGRNSRGRDGDRGGRGGGFRGRGGASRGRDGDRGGRGGGFRGRGGASRGRDGDRGGRGGARGRGGFGGRQSQGRDGGRGARGGGGRGGGMSIRQFGDAVETGQNGTWDTGPSAKDIAKSHYEEQMAIMMAGNAVDTGNMGADLIPSTPIAARAEIQIDENKPPASPPGDDSSDEEMENPTDTNKPAPPTPVITQQFQKTSIDEDKPPATPPQSSSDSDDED